MPIAVTLIIHSPDGLREIILPGDRLTLGRTEMANVVIGDDGLSRLHASINRSGERVWIFDENSTNGSFVNGQSVSPNGTILQDGDQISIGNATTVQVLLNARAQSTHTTTAAAAAQQQQTSFPVAQQGNTNGAQSSLASRLGIILALVMVATFLIVAALGVYAWRRHSSDERDRHASSVTHGQTYRATDADSLSDAQVNNTASSDVGETAANFNPNASSPTPLAETTASAASPQSSPTNAPLFAITPQPTSIITAKNLPMNPSRKLYLQMTPEEQMEFIEVSAQHVSTMMGNRPYAFTPEVLQYIKGYVDGYARRVGNNSTKLWGEDLRFMFARAHDQYSPFIVQAFNRQGVPAVVGLYLCVIETEYHNIQSENFAGAAGLFQFIGPTAEAYGVPRAERTNVEKMAPAAAKYIAQRIAEFGTDSMSVALGIAGYNRNPDSVRRDLRDVLDSENKERSFWTLVANSTKLDHWFQGENIKYVPKFFAAAIVGEHPWAFNLEMRPLSTYTELPSKMPAAPPMTTTASASPLPPLQQQQPSFRPTPTAAPAK